MIFETDKLIIRKLKTTDIEPFNMLQSNPKVLQYATGKVQTFSEAETNLKSLIDKYDLVDNDFWIYAVVKKFDNKFLGTVAVVKEASGDNEIGYRLIEKYWGKGYALEAAEGLVKYCKTIGIPKLVAYAIDMNKASVIILEKLNFKKKLKSKYKGLPETKYELFL